MPPNNINNKSQKMSARVPHEVAQAVESAKEEGESTAQFIVTALEGEIKRRKRKKPSVDSAD
ncbi:YlcI/YnfO family protein [Enterobacter sp. Lyrl_3]|uniref:YlcI/YnfO family protein n=1 Tax=Enterobacter sp. Lyrl_3 TaxID=3110922 RepID=UPI003F81AC45